MSHQSDRLAADAVLVHANSMPKRWYDATPTSISLDTYSHAIPAMQEEAAERIAGLVVGGR